MMKSISSQNDRAQYLLNRASGLPNQKPHTEGAENQGILDKWKYNFKEITVSQSDQPVL